jgi:hypothetical protein
VDIVAYLLKARTVESDKQPLLANGFEITSVSRPRLGKHIPTSTGTHVTIEVLLQTMFSTRSVSTSYKEDNWRNQVSSVWEAVKRGLERGT